MRRAFIGRRTDGVGAKRTTPDDLIAVQPSRLSQSRNCFGRFASGQQGDFEAAQRVIAAPQYLACAKPGSGRMTGKREVPVKIRQSSGLPASTREMRGLEDRMRRNRVKVIALAFALQIVVPGAGGHVKDQEFGYWKVARREPRPRRPEFRWNSDPANSLR